VQRKATSGSGVIRRGAVVVAAATAIVVAASSPASAYTRQYLSEDSPNYAGVGDDRRWVEVCDMERDGNGVKGEFVMINGRTMTVGDGNGSAAGCGNKTAPADIRKFRVILVRNGFIDAVSHWKEVG